MINRIIEAAQFLNLGDRATLSEINSKYKALLFKWHPDHCKEAPCECKAMTEKTIESYKIIMNYCNSYKFSFKKNDLEKNPVAEYPEKFWHDKFGHDPLWGYPK